MFICFKSSETKDNCSRLSILTTSKQRARAIATMYFLRNKFVGKPIEIIQSINNI